MYAPTFFHGIAIALIVSVPLGPMALLCIKRTYSHGFWAGWATSLGIASGDTIFALIAGLSLSFLTDKIEQYKNPISLLGVIFLLGFGLFTIYSKIEPNRQNEKKLSFSKSYYTSLILSLSNLLTLLGMVALASWFSATECQPKADTLLMATGVFIGVLSWFTMINILLHFLKDRVKIDALNKINKIIGTGICLVSILMLIRLYLQTCGVN